MTTHLAVPGADAINFQTSFERVLPRLEALREDELIVVSTDVRRAAVVALAVAERLATRSRRAPFERLSESGQFDLAALDALADVARAARFVRNQVGLSDAQATKARVTPALFDEAIALRRTMLRVCDYYLSDDATGASQIAAVRASAGGYQGLIDSLLALASIYEGHAAELSRDPHLYQSGDAARARQTASSLSLSVGASALAPSAPWHDLLARAWTLLVTTYAAVQRAGRFVTPGGEGVRLYPSLVGSGRAKRKRHAGGEPSEPPQTGAGEPAGGGQGAPVGQGGAVGAAGAEGAASGGAPAGRSDAATTESGTMPVAKPVVRKGSAA